MLAITATLLEAGADHGVLKARSIKTRDAINALGNRYSNLDFLMDRLFSPSKPAPIPSFRIV